MSGYKRSFLYWFRIMEQQFLIWIGSCLVVAVFFGTGEDSREILASYIPMMGIIMILVFSMNGPVLYIPQGISFGATRREIFTGMEIMMHLIALQVALLSMLFIQIDSESGILGYLTYNAFMNKPEMCMLFGTFYLLVCSVGNGVNVVTIKFGKTVGMIVYILCVIVLTLGAVFGISLALLGDMGSVLIENLSSILTAGIAGSVILDTLVIAAGYQVIKKYEVRA